VKRLYKSRKNKVIDGVCGGIGEYFGVDPVMVRVIFVLFFFFGGSAILAYIIGMLIMPRAPLNLEQEKKSEKESSSYETAKPTAIEPKKESNTASTIGAGGLVVGIIMIILGGFFLLDNLNFPFVHRFSWWFWHNFWDIIIPGALILLGLLLIFKSKEN